MSIPGPKSWFLSHDPLPQPMPKHNHNKFNKITCRLVDDRVSSTKHNLWLLCVRTKPFSESLTRLFCLDLQFEI